MKKISQVLILGAMLAVIAITVIVGLTWLLSDFFIWMIQTNRL